jgi:MFS transporter, DHA2 family, multidrug resistance protein
VLLLALPVMALLLVLGPLLLPEFRKVTAITGAILLAALAVMTAALLRDVPSPQARREGRPGGEVGAVTAGALVAEKS